MNAQKKPSPEKIQRLTTGGWACAALGTAVTYKLFTHIHDGCHTAEAIAKAAGLSPRGTQALLDGLVGLELLTLKDGRYENGPDAAEYLVEGRDTFMGGFSRMSVGELAKWARLPEAVKSGRPVEDVDVAENPFWEDLVASIAPSSAPLAQAAAAGLKIADAGPIEILDVGGGSGIYSAIMLKKNPQAKSTQLDWANVNRVARSIVDRHGVAERFSVIDGDFHREALPAGRYDVIIYSHIAHMEPPEENVRIFARLRAALKPGGTLVVADFVQADDRSGPPFALQFHLNMLLHTRGGATYRQSDYRTWLVEAGFRDVTIEPTEGPASLVYAR